MTPISYTQRMVKARVIGRPARAAAFDPGDLPGAVFWGTVASARAAGRLWQDLDMSVPATADGDRVRAIQSFGGVNSVTGDDASRGTLTDEGGGKWSIEVTASFQTGDLSASFPTQGTCWVAFEAASDDENFKALQTGPFDAWDYFSGLSYPQHFRATRLNSKPPVTRGSPTHYVIRSDGTAWDRYQGGAEDLTAAADYSAGGQWTIGGDDMAGKIFAWGGVARRVSDAERLQLAAYLAAVIP